ncbi:hypothetical protein EJ04DRAFT_558046 [Polyplosphaeria fusca]|uniref:Uncharacterized protein n=1 Tax=Polyplosphaeria fusca TaxID=682080 RepID=A0A9P4RDS1_9PLEO|nr:hypothetical protein EJ04DRAFT_558046 [Polyplosphaeria fusca]
METTDSTHESLEQENTVGCYHASQADLSLDTPSMTTEADHSAPPVGERQVPDSKVEVPILLTSFQQKKSAHILSNDEVDTSINRSTISIAENAGSTTKTGTSNIPKSTHDRASASCDEHPLDQPNNPVSRRSGATTTEQNDPLYSDPSVLPDEPLPEIPQLPQYLPPPPPNDSDIPWSVPPSSPLQETYDYTDGRKARLLESARLADRQKRMISEVSILEADSKKRRKEETSRKINEARARVVFQDGTITSLDKLRREREAIQIQQDRIDREWFYAKGLINKFSKQMDDPWKRAACINYKQAMNLTAEDRRRRVEMSGSEMKILQDRYQYLLLERRMVKVLDQMDLARHYTDNREKEAERLEEKTETSNAERDDSVMGVMGDDHDSDESAACNTFDLETYAEEERRRKLLAESDTEWDAQELEKAKKISLECFSDPPKSPGDAKPTEKLEVEPKVDAGGDTLMGDAKDSMLDGSDALRMLEEQTQQDQDIDVEMGDVPEDQVPLETISKEDLRGGGT